MDRKALLDNVSREVDVICDGLLTFIKLSEAERTGIDFAVDAQFGTDYSLFATLGPNGNDLYGRVALAFKNDVLAHPDTDMTPMAATLYRSKAALCMRRPWVVAGVQAVGANDLPTLEAAGFGFDPLPPHGPPRTVDILEGNYTLTDLQGMHAWKMNQLNAGFSDDWAEVLAREACATARLYLTRLRPHYTGQGKYRVAEDPYAPTANLAIKNFRVLPKDWQDPCPGDETPWEERISAELIIDYYESCEAHAKVECHLPGVLHMGAVEYIWMTQDAIKDLVNHTNMTQTRRVGAEISSKEGLVLPDGRVFRVVLSPSGYWEAAHESRSLLTICANDQEIFDQQSRFMRERYGDPRLERPKTSFRTDSGIRLLKLGGRWLPRLEDCEQYLKRPAKSWRTGVAVSWMSNANDGLEVGFAAEPYHSNDVPAMYAINIGRNWKGMWNAMTEVLKIDGGLKGRAAVDSRRSPRSMCATPGNGGGGCWQRYWAGVCYSDEKTFFGGSNSQAFVLFGRLGPTEEMPTKVRVRGFPKSEWTAGAGAFEFRSDNDVCQPCQPVGPQQAQACMPILHDRSPIKDVRHVGFTCFGQAKFICRLQVHPAPVIERV